MNFILILLLSISFAGFASSQQLINSPADSDHLKKQYENNKGEVLYCGVPLKQNVKFYIIEKQADLILYKEFLPNDKIKVIGYYRLIFDGESYCWQKDLNWIYFNEEGKIILEEFYSEHSPANSITH